MIKTLLIERFKSIKSLSITCRKVNVFIGAPDTGKTNILEALYFLSRLGWGLPLDTSLRLNQHLGFDPLFYRQFFDQPFQIVMNLVPRPDIGMDNLFVRATIEGQNRQLKIECPWGANYLQFGQQWHIPQLHWVRFYSYTTSEHWAYNSNYHQGTKIINPPHGYNLLYIARHNERVYNFFIDTVAALNWRLRFDPTLKIFRLSDVKENEIIDYNLELVSDTLKRLFFYGSILHTSENTTIVLDEPDVYAFPPFPKTLGEMIGADRSNQFFLTTHNPYFLSGIIGKTTVEDLALFVCSRNSEGSTTAKLLSPEEVSRVIEQGASAFFNLSDFLDS